MAFTIHKSCHFQLAKGHFTFLALDLCLHLGNQVVEVFNSTILFILKVKRHIWVQSLASLRLTCCLLACLNDFGQAFFLKFLKVHFLSCYRELFV